MNDRFDKAFAEVFGDMNIACPIENAKHCMPNRAAMMPTVGHKTASRSSMYPGSVGARNPITLKSGHESLTAKCRHNGQP